MRTKQNWNKIQGILNTLAFFLTLTFSVSAFAVELKTNLTVDGRAITLGDLFADMGSKADIIVFNAPAPGKSKTIAANDLARLAEKYEIDWQKPDYLKKVSVSRRGHTISSNDIQSLIHDIALESGADPDSQIRFFGRNNGVLVPMDATAGDIKFENFSLSDKGDRFSAVLLVPSGGDVPTRLSLNGVLEEVRDIPVFNSSIMPGEIIRSSDLRWIKYPAKRLNGRVIMNSQQLVGMTVRRPARTDKPITTNDVTAPIAVAKGDAVTMTVRTRAMILSAGGKALENGGVGDTIRVINSKSRLTVDAKIIRSGHVEILSGPTLALGSQR